MIVNSPLFESRGVHCVVDGQFGSTGKGALSAWLADHAIQCGLGNMLCRSIYNGGPNSGHTFYLDDEKVVLKQLPTFAVYLCLRGFKARAYLSAGAIIDREILKAEAMRYPSLQIFVHPNAAIVTDEDKEAELTGSIAEVAGTRSGTGAALARKIMRDPKAIARESLGYIAHNVVLQDHPLIPATLPYFMEVSQGFSLGINSRFYPKVTSRECTVMQGLADARIPPPLLSRTYMAIRTFPIRVGNVDGFSSGDWYPDQQEVSWEQIGRVPELTTVTQRVRRIATFSMIQFIDACYANMPNLVFASHMDYLDKPDRALFKEAMVDTKKLLDMEYLIMYSSGPKVADVEVGATFGGLLCQ